MKRLISLAAAALLFAIPAAAQELSVEAVEGSMEVYFGKGLDVSLRNWRGEPGQPGAWNMRRKITGARVPRRCVIELRVPTVIENRDGNPKTSWTIEWAGVTDIKWDGVLTVRFRTGSMAAGEYAELTAENKVSAEQLEAVFTCMADECARG